MIGKTAWIGAVCTLTERSAWEAEELLHALERKQLVQRVRRSSIEGETEFTFTHALTRDVAYSQIRRADRAQKHEAAAGGSNGSPASATTKPNSWQTTTTNALLCARSSAKTRPASRPRREPRSPRPPARPQPCTPTRPPPATTAPRSNSPQLTTPSSAPRSCSARPQRCSDADVADEQILQAAVDAQVAAEAWEAAARPSGCSPSGTSEHEAQRRGVEACTSPSADYAARVPPERGDVPDRRRPGLRPASSPAGPRRRSPSTNRDDSRSPRKPDLEVGSATAPVARLRAASRSATRTASATCAAPRTRSPAHRIRRRRMALRQPGRYCCEAWATWPPPTTPSHRRPAGPTASRAADTSTGSRPSRHSRPTTPPTGTPPSASSPRSTPPTSSMTSRFA